ncbi:carbohydrate kinase family protein [Arthrobacter sp. Soil762]|uniref:carbohydrate kinase family protein n=1 Tax=Arthrobacter sp. Soil762 TaxID=1736401 RepID=UPI0006F33E74|nr:PfkB family carbohydrate kinase [Arthrobacter sp. Soil762]KRE72706.1 hypothetical protein ASG77_08560 [Arthrobacter sp. Soil762]
MSSSHVKYAILSHVIIDDIVHADGREDPGHLGGAGAYAALGAALAASDGEVGIVAKVGLADRSQIAAEFVDRGISVEGLAGVQGPSPRSTLRYFEDGERIETPQHGDAHFEALTPMPADIPESWAGLEGVYLFHDADPEYWRAVGNYRSTHNVTLLWEISAAACTPEQWDSVRSILQMVDVFSINRTEARALLGTDSLSEAVERLREAAPLVFLRLGEHGSLLIRSGETLAFAPVPTSVIDPTGGGNSYSGAALVGLLASKGDPAAAARTAAAVASLVIGQFSLPSTGPEQRSLVRQRSAAANTKDLRLLLL